MEKEERVKEALKNKSDSGTKCMNRSTTLLLLSILSTLP